MAEIKNLKTRIILTHDEYSNLKTKHLKNGEVVLAKVGEITEGNVTQPVFMMKVGTAEETKTVAELPWLMAPAADVYGWAKKENPDWADFDFTKIPAIPGASLGIDVDVTGEGNAITNASWDPTTKILTLTKDETFATKKEFDEHTHNNKADKVADATAGNFAGLNAEGNLIDSGKKAADFAEAGHNHDNAYKKIQTAVAEKGAADKTLKISQDAQGVITTEAISIQIAQSQVDGLTGALNGKSDVNHNHEASELTNFAADVEAVVNNLGVTTEGINDLTSRLGQAETDIDNLETNKADKATYEAKVAELEAAVGAAQADADEANSKIDAFMGTIEAGGDAVDTLQEVIDLIEAGDDVATGLLSDVANLKAADVTLQANIDRKADQTDLDALVAEVGHDVIPGNPGSCDTTEWDDIPATGLYAKIDEEVVKLNGDIDKLNTRLSLGFDEQCDGFGIYEYIDKADNSLADSILQLSIKVGEPYKPGDPDSIDPCDQFDEPATGLYAEIEEVSNELSDRIGQPGDPDCDMAGTGVYAYVDAEIDDVHDTINEASQDTLLNSKYYTINSLRTLHSSDGSISITNTFNISDTTAGAIDFKLNSELNDKIDAGYHSLKSLNAGTGLKLEGLKIEGCDSGDWYDNRYLTINIDEEVVFVLDGGTAADLD